MLGDFVHAPARARGADTAAFAGERERALMFTVGGKHTDKAVRRIAAGEKVREGLVDGLGQMLAALGGVGQEAVQLALGQAVARRSLTRALPAPSSSPARITQRRTSRFSASVS